MGNFSESTLLASGMSAVDFFANKGNQESVLEEISVFGDAELKAAFVRLFNPPAAADPYLTGSAAITESEIAQMQARRRTTTCSRKLSAIPPGRRYVALLSGSGFLWRANGRCCSVRTRACWNFISAVMPCMKTLRSF